MLYIIRHADAVSNENDDLRALSAEGRAQVRRLAAFLKRGETMAPDEIWHSPLVRARETATLLAEALDWKGTVRTVPGLRSEDEPSTIAPRLKTPRSIALVGHEPHLSGLASLLVAGLSEPPVILMRKCAMLALERQRDGEAGCWAVCWHIAPELLGSAPP